MSSRKTLGDKFSEGARLLWKALKERKWTQRDAERALGAQKGTVIRLLFGDRRPGATLAASLESVLDIPASSWAMLPKQAFKVPENRGGKAA